MHGMFCVAGEPQGWFDFGSGGCHDYCLLLVGRLVGGKVLRLGYSIVRMGRGLLNETLRSE